MVKDDVEVFQQGFDELEKMLAEYVDNCGEEKVLSAIEDGTKDFVGIVRKIPKPYSKIAKPGYTHLLDTITSKRINNQVIVGWGKYYGRMVESGTVKMKAQPHLGPQWERSKETIYRNIINKVFKER